MALVIADRVRETTTTAGTGDIALNGAVVGYQSFSLGVGSGNTTYYVIADQNGANWECGLGTLDGTGTTLTRTTVISSSNSNTLVNFGSGTKDVFCAMLASKAIYKDNTGAPVGAGTVTSASVVSANGFAGTVATASSTPAITMTVTFSGLAKGSGGALSAAVAGTDYLAPPSGTALLKANSGGALANAVAGTDYLAPPSGSAILKANAGGALANAVAGTDYQAAITASGLLKGAGSGSVSAAVAGTDYAPATSGTAILKGNNAGGFAAAVAKTDYAPATSGSAILKGDGTGGFANAVAKTDYAPATSGSAILKGDGLGGFSAAAAGTDYAPATSGTAILYGNGAGGFSAVTIGSNLTFSGGTLSASATAQVYPAAGIAVSTGTAWTTSKTAPTGAIVGDTDTQTLSNKTLSGAILSGNTTGSDGALTRVMLQDTGWNYFDSTTTAALDYTNGSVQRWAPTASSSPTLSISNWPPSGDLGELLVEAVNLGAAGTITFPTANWIKSDGTFAASPSAAGVTLQSSGTDFILFWTRNAGTTLYAKVIR